MKSERYYYKRLKDATNKSQLGSLAYLHYDDFKAK